MNKEEILNVGVCCGGRSSQMTYNNFVKMYSYAKENGFKGINITFVDPELDKLQQKVNQLETELAKYKLRETALNKLNERIGLNAIHGNVYGKTYDELVEILERGKE